MIDLRFLFAGIAIMLIIIVRELLKKYYNFDMDNLEVDKSCKKWRRFIKIMITNFLNFKKQIFGKAPIIEKNTGTNSLIILETGENKATVMATLRQILEIDYKTAKEIVEFAPCKFLVNISDKEAELTKKALEFVGAKIEIRRDKN
ncbi:ribosomal protein L7/L12 [bacterium]|nr:ribosomal protein L7/L12 [bacterium]